MKPSQPPKPKRQKRLNSEEVKEVKEALKEAASDEQASTVPTSSQHQQLFHAAAAAVPPYMMYPCYPPHPNPYMMTMAAPFAHAFPFHPQQQQQQAATTATTRAGDVDVASSITPRQQAATTTGTATATATTRAGVVDASSTTPRQQAATTTGTATAPTRAGVVDASSTTPSAEEQHASGGIPWYCPETLERSLKDREARGASGLNETESRILGLLVTHQAAANRRKSGAVGGGGGKGSKVASVTIPGRRGCPPQTYVRHPVKRRVQWKQKSVREIVDLLKEVCDRCEVDREDVLRYLGKKEADKRTEEDKLFDKKLMIRQSITLMKEARLSDRKYHEIRMFIAKIWGIDVGVPLQVINDYRKENPSIPEVNIIRAHFASKRTKIIDRKRPRKRNEDENEG